MIAGSWQFILILYSYGVLSMSATGLMAPIAGDIGRGFGGSTQLVGLAISASFLVPAIGSTWFGWLVGRIGPRRALVLGAAIFLATDAGSYLAPSLGAFIAIRACAGVGFALLTNAGPAWIMAETGSSRQIQAMSLWSTFVPAGWILGPLLAAPIAGASYWRLAFLAHAVFALACLIIAMWLPRPARTAAPPRISLSAILKNYRPIRLAAAFSATAISGLGPSTILPLFLVSTYHIMPARASELLSVSTIVTLFGGLICGLAMTRGFRLSRIMSVFIVLGIIALFAVFFWHVGISQIIFGLMAWSLAQGACIALQMALLPHMVDTPAARPAAAGILNQVASLGSFITAPLYFIILPGYGGPGIACVSAMFWVMGAGLTPIWGRRRTQLVPAHPAAEST